MDTNVSYPARLILSRYAAHYNPPALVIVDPRAIEGPDDLAGVLAYYQTMESMRGAVQYNKTLVPVAEVEATVARLYAEMEREAAGAQAPAAPAPQAPAPTGPSALDRAYLAARAAFRGDKKALGRLQEALPLVRGGLVEPLGGGEFRVTAHDRAYTVNGSCACAEFGLVTEWCCHRLAVALFCKAARLEAEDATNDEAGSAPTLPAPSVPTNGDRPRVL